MSNWAPASSLTPVSSPTAATIRRSYSNPAVFSSGYSLSHLRLQDGSPPTIDTLEQGLEPLFPQDAAKHAIAIDGNDVLHIAHKLNPEFGDEHIQHLQVASGLPVRDTIVATDSSLGSIAIAVDSGGFAHACYDLGSTLYYASNSSGTWVPTDTDQLVAGTAGGGCDIAVDDDGRIYISFLGSAGLGYLTNESGTWVAATIDPHSGSAPGVWLRSTSIGVAADGAVHIAFFHDRADGLEYATNASGTWAVSIIDPGEDVGSDCDLALDSAGNVHIAYLDHTDLELLKYATNAGGAWQPELLANARPWFAEIAVDSMDRIHVVFADAAGNLAYTTTAGP